MSADSPEKKLLNALTENRYDLAERLVDESKQLEGVRSRHLVDQASLCTVCKHAAIWRQASRNQRLIRCQVLGQFMPEDIVECSLYQSITALSLSQMVDLATLIDDRSDKTRGYL